ncbi:FHA domain-containing protein [Microbacterium sp. TNHR37B]|uniref:FHA domain-containing protein n=1 Tax=Microbacterium sp. TNHR37B TaxID=1775956 RepID=UPI0007B2A43C|nr:FHA domain-containing protein [Microbacterium sp. TNHR37B]KZE91445.1 hypothetical protein AVP41_00987 [Microbacterium sp. TNHR37B]
MTEITGLVLAGQAIMAVAVYVWIALALSAAFRKAGEQPGKAWVPVLNAWVLFVLAGMRGWWSVVVAGAIAVGAGVSIGLGGVFGAAALEASFEGDTAGAQSALLMATLIPGVVWLAVLAFAVVLHIRQQIALNARFGLGTGSIVLGVLLFPVWASIVGWGSARWLGDRPAGAPASGAPAPAPAAPIVPPLADFSARPAGTSPFATTSAPFASGPAPASATPFLTPDAPVAPSAPDTMAAGGPPPAAPIGGNPWAPPVPSAPPATVPVAPAPGVPGAGTGSGSETGEHTVIVDRRATTWSLLLPGGAQATLTGSAAVLGRNPVAPAHAPHAQPVAIDDVTRTVSKTHALLSRSEAGWTISDLSSTNGVFVGPTADAATEVVGTAEVDGPFFLGDAAIVLRRDS